MADNTFYITQYENRLRRLDQNSNFVFDALEMKKLLGAEYQAYSKDASTSLGSSVYSTSARAEDWWARAEKLLKNVTFALNCGQVTLEKATDAQRQRAELFQAEAEQLFIEFEDNIRHTPDVTAFTICEDMLEVMFDTLYCDAHHLIEHWVLPMKKKSSSGTDPASYKREMQRQYLQRALDKLRGEPTQSFQPKRSAKLTKLLRECGLPAPD